MRRLLRISSLLFRQHLSIILEYRANFIMRIVAGFVSLLFMAAVWQGLRPQEFQSTIWQFYIMAGLIGAFTGEGFYREMAADINKGQLSFYLLQSFPYLGRIVARLIADAVVNIGITLTTLFILSFFLHGTVRIEVFSLLIALPLIILGRTIGVLLNFLAGCISFFWISPDALYLVFDTVLFFLFGSLFPFWLLPKFWQNLFVFLPFQAVIAAPTEAAMGLESRLPMNFVSALVWCGLLGLIAYRLWRRVLIYYEAVGG
jgi:ABC-2 type transport system permease protein